MYYDVLALAATAQCRETRQGDTMSGGRHDDLSSLHVTALDESYFFIRHNNFMRYKNLFSDSEPKAQVHYSDHVSSVVRR